MTPGAGPLMCEVGLDQGCGAQEFLGAGRGELASVFPEQADDSLRRRAKVTGGKRAAAEHVIKPLEYHGVSVGQSSDLAVAGGALGSREDVEVTVAWERGDELGDAGDDRG